jgi:hypothetical protein
MSTISDELFAIADQLEVLKNESDTLKVSNPLNKLQTSAEQVQKSWCGSWLGHHSRIYYKGLQIPPPGARFSQMDGMRDNYFSDTIGDWCEYNFDRIKEEIYRIAGNPDLNYSKELSKKVIESIEDKRAEIISLLTTMQVNQNDSFVSDLRKKTENIRIFNQNDYINALRPSRVMTRDYAALGQGVQVPPHVEILVELLEIKGIFEDCKTLTSLARRAASHIARQERHVRRNQEIGTTIFIGHGRSPVWKDFKDFIQDRLRLPWDEFNRVPVAGITNCSALANVRRCSYRIYHHDC